MKILLIAGHGDGDSGAVGNGYEEADLTREFAELLFEKLKALCDVDLADKNRNWFEYLGKNNYDFSKYNYVLEIHFNSGGGTGSEVYVTNAENGVTVEESILKNMCNIVGYRNRGVKRKDFRVISRVKSQGISSALLEVCFIDSSSDVSTYQNNKNMIADSVVSGIAEGFGIKYQPIDEMTSMCVDESKIPSWAENAVTWCSENKILPDNSELNLDDTKMWICTVLYNTVKFLAHQN